MVRVRARVARVHLNNGTFLDSLDYTTIEVIQDSDSGKREAYGNYCELTA